MNLIPKSPFNLHIYRGLLLFTLYFIVSLYVNNTALICFNLSESTTFDFKLSWIYYGQIIFIKVYHLLPTCPSNSNYFYFLNRYFFFKVQQQFLYDHVGIESKLHHLMSTARNFVFSFYFIFLQYYNFNTKLLMKQTVEHTFYWHEHKFVL